MNERLVFLIAIPLADVGASVAVFLLFPGSPLVNHFGGLLSYATAHALPSLGLWVVLTTLAVALMPRIWRLRQNRSSKRTLLGRIGAVGLLFDALGSLYLWYRTTVDAPDSEGSMPGLYLGLRLALYLAVFVLTVLCAERLADWNVRRNPPASTPPPRFGRN